MSRSVAYRRNASDAVSWRQDQALNATIYILRNTGPTGFLLKEEGESKKFKVYLGDPHHCTCPVFTKEKDLCKHICWVLLKKFRIPRQNPVTWQLGLVEREVNEILRGATSKTDQRPSATARQLARLSGAVASLESDSPTEEEGSIPQREISEEDVCPICQDELLARHLPVTYCRFGCGNNVHIKCMKVWAEHQRSTGDTNIKCPFCRENFGPFSLLQQEFRNATQTRAERVNEHLGIACKKCNTCPVVGKCYKCTTCANYHLCQNCFNTPTHMEHAFEFKLKPNQRWRPAPQRGDTHILPQAVVQNLMSRDISEEDYDLLLQLDSQATQEVSDLTEETIRSFPMERVRRNSTLLAPGTQCRVCLRAYKEGESVRRLPCRHKFHKDCIDNWLLHHHATCPIDGTVYTNDSVRVMREAQRNSNTLARPSSPSYSNSLRTLQQRRDMLEPSEQGQGGSRLHGTSRTNSTVDQRGALSLEIPGIGIARRPTSGTMAEQGANRQNGSARSQPAVGRRAPRGPTHGLSITGMAGVQDSTDGVLAEMARHNTPSMISGMGLSGANQTQFQLRAQETSAEPQAEPLNESSARHNNIQFNPSNIESNQRQASEVTGHVHSNIRRLSRNETSSIQSGDTADLMVGNPNAEAQRIDSGGRRREGRGSAGERPDVAPREPVAPSIPQRGSAASVSLGLDNSEGMGRKPPTGAQANDNSGAGGARAARLRTRPLYREPGTRGNASGTRERSNSANRRNSSAPSGQLFVGHNPSTTAAFTSEYTTSGGPIAHRKPKKNQRPSEDPRYRWGSTANPAEEIIMNGSALNGLSLNDLLSP